MEYIVFGFGVPMIVVTDFEKTLNDLKVQHSKAPVSYPQSNGQVEITNKAILHGIKKRLTEANINWVDELPNVLWSHRTSP